MRTILCSLFVLLFAGCQEETPRINKAGELLFRRSYAAIQFRDVSDQELDSIEKSNPWPVNSNASQQDSLLMFHLQKEGILDGSLHLVRSKFPETVPLQFTLTNQKRKQLHLSITPRVPGEITNTYNLVLINKKQKIVYELESHYGGTSRDISYLVLDLIPGGYPEIVILNEYYIMNGDNSDIFIYEITN
jgi:hypothetical protein